MEIAESGGVEVVGSSSTRSYQEEWDGLVADFVDRIEGWKSARKALVDRYGEELVCVGTFEQLSKGQAGMNVLHSNIPGSPHWVNPETGLKINDRGIEEVAGDPFADNIGRFAFLIPNPTEDQRAAIRWRLGESRMAYHPDVNRARSEHLTAVVRANRRDIDQQPIDCLAGVAAAMNGYSRAKNVYMDTLRLKSITPQILLEDFFDLLGSLPVWSGAIYRHLYTSNLDRVIVIPPQQGQSFADAYVWALGTAQGDEALAAKQSSLLNVLLNLQCYHGKGNASTNAACIAGGTNATVYQSYYALLGALSGVFHGDATNIAGRIFYRLWNDFGDLWRSNPTAAKAKLREWLVELLEYGKEKSSGTREKVIACGHRVVKVDPRGTITDAKLEELFASHTDYELVKMAHAYFEIAMPLLAEMGMQNRVRNVDGMTGIAHMLAGIVMEESQMGTSTMTFGVSRALALSEVLFGQVLGIPLTRPKMIRDAKLLDGSVQSAIREELAKLAA